MPGDPNQLIPVDEARYETHLWQVLGSSKRNRLYKFVRSSGINSTENFTEGKLKTLLTKPGHPRIQGRGLLYIGKFYLIS